MSTAFTDTERAILRIVQFQLPDTLTPYADIAREVGTDEETVLNLLHRMKEDGSIRRFDGDTRPHQHVRCRVCGKIGDVIPPVPTPSVEGVSVEGFTITEARVEYEGICEECARKAS